MNQSKVRVFAVFQKIGKSLMLPVSVLPAAGLMIAISRIIEHLFKGPEAVASNIVLSALIQILFKGGLVIFENLPLIFAIGVAIGFTGGEAVAGLASAVGYGVLINVLDIMANIQNLQIPIEMGVFSGIITGLVAAYIYKKYYKTKLNPILGFFEGKRLVPIVMVAVSCILGIVFGLVWPFIQNIINYLGQLAINAQIGGVKLGGAIYAFGNRALIPIGLHHVFKTPFTTQFGEYISPITGEKFVGEIARFFAGDPTAGHITAAEYPLKLFGLPAAALAIYLTARPENKKAIGGIMLTASLTSIITGITEPIEFAFMFSAPILYITHIVLAFIGGLLVNIAGIRLSETFTSSLIDYFVSIATGNAGNPIMILPIGMIMFVLYFVSFYFFIKKFNLKTPGRDEDFKEKDAVSFSQKASKVLKALGNYQNIKHIDACITRLRLELNDSSLIDKEGLKKLGASGIMSAGKGDIQVVFGTEAEFLKDEIKSIIKSNNVLPKDIFNDSIVLKSPIKGKIVDIADVPDDVFAQKLLGDGVAIEPIEGVVYSPVDGEITQLFGTKHAVGIVTDDELELLIHIGIDTVKLKGEGFKTFVSQGDKIKSGDKLIEFDLDLIKEKAKSTITPFLITNMSKIKEFKLLNNNNIDSKQDLIIIKK